MSARRQSSASAGSARRQSDARRPSERFERPDFAMSARTSDVFHQDENDDDEAQVAVKYSGSSYWPRTPSFSRKGRGVLAGLTPSTPLKEDVFRVALIGAGNVMFGSDEGPWNLTSRLELKVGARLRVIALIDPDAARCKAQLDAKLGTEVAVAYKETKVYRNVDDFIAATPRPQWPRCVIVGSPPAFRGSDKPGRDVEMRLLDAMPGVSMFLEKPVSTDEVPAARRVAQFMEERKDIVSIGYHLRYLKVVQKLKRIIEANNLQVMSIIAIYSASYERIAKPGWWMKSRDCGPVVEQGTHFADLSRYIGGDVDLDTVMAHAVEHDEPAGELSVIPVDESIIAPEDRIPRVTTASWKFKSGAVGTLIHSAVLQGAKYATELQVFADGFMFRLLDPYNNPKLIVRRPDSDAEEEFSYPGDDPYQGEMDAFIDTVEHGIEQTAFFSSYNDAVDTYELTWAITHAAEASTAKRRAKGATGKPAGSSKLDAIVEKVSELTTS